jgi:hypothetical protein
MSDGAASAPLRILASRKRAVFIVTMFVVSRCAYLLAGVRFNAQEIWYSFQILPEDLLRHHLFQSLYYLHTQPPAFNLLVGLGLLVGGGHIWPLTAVYLVMGVAIAFGVDTVLRLFGVSARTALVITTLFVISPSVVLFENYLFYDYPMLLCTVGSVAAAGLFLHRRSSGALIGCSAFLAAAALLRPTFHPVTIIAAVAFLVLVAGVPRVPTRTWITVAVVVLVPVVLLLKNAVLFGQPTFSSWVGWNMGHVTTYAIPIEERERLVADGTLSPVALIKPFAGLRKFESIPGLACRPRRGDPPALTRVNKGAGDDPNVAGGGIPNLNNRCYLKIFDKARQDAIAAFRARPSTFVKSEVQGYLEYGIVPASDYRRLGRDNLDHARPARTAEDIVLLTWLSPISRSGQLKHLSPLIGLAYGLAALGFLVALRRVRRRRATSTIVDRLALWTGALVGYGIVVSYALDVHENMRFRFPFDPLAIALAIYALRAVGSLGADGRDQDVDRQDVETTDGLP